MGTDSDNGDRRWPGQGQLANHAVQAEGAMAAQWTMQGWQEGEWQQRTPRRAGGRDKVKTTY